MGPDEMKLLTEGAVSRDKQLYTTEFTGIDLVRAPSKQPNPVSTSVELLQSTSTCHVHGIRKAVIEKQLGSHISMNLCSKSTTYYSKIASFLGNSPGQFFARGL